MDSEDAVQALRRSGQDPEAFVVFYDRHSQRLLAYFAKRVFDAEVALDLTAETFAQAFRGRRRFRGSTNEAAAAWLYKIASRQLNRYIRKGAAERKALRRLAIETPRIDAGQEARIEELAELADLRAVLRIELARLSPERREALQLRVVEELPYSEIAARLDISEQAARARVSRALKALRSAMDGKRPVGEAR